jgi:hypothetical protein
MKKLFRHKGIAAAILAVAAIFMGCATTGGTAGGAPPAGIYYNYYRGHIAFSTVSFNPADAAGAPDAAAPEDADVPDGFWESTSLGYRGSFKYDQETSGVNLTAQQELKGLQWVDIDPIDSFISGQTGSNFITLGDLKFRKI